MEYDVENCKISVFIRETNYLSEELFEKISNSIETYYKQMKQNGIWTVQNIWPFSGSRCTYFGEVKEMSTKKLWYR
jgi:hypothetical protein